MIPAFTHWESYYVIVGSSAAALTGLQFVVIALVAESTQRVPTSMRAIAAYGSPTVVHFCSVLLVAALLTAPWSNETGAALALTAVGLAGILYGVVVALRARTQREYRPVFSDWIWHTVLPTIGYASIFLAAISLRGASDRPLFLLGAAALLLLFIGIHNSWDTVTYVAISLPAAQGSSGSERESPPSKTVG